MITKYIYIQVNDYLKLQQYLNLQSANGYHAKKITPLTIHFEYDPSNQYYYQVTLPNKEDYRIKDGYSKNKKDDFMSAFGLISIPSSLIFGVYYSTENITLNTDFEIDEKSRYELIKSILQSNILPITLILLNIFSLFQLDMYQIIMSGMIQSTIVLSFLSISYVIKSLINLKKIKNGKLSTKISYRWNIRMIDPIVILIYLQVILIIGLTIPAKVLIPFSIIAALGFLQIIIKSKIMNTHIKRNLRFLNIALVFLITIFMILPTFRYGHKPYSYTEESLFAKEQGFFESNDSMVTLNIKSQLFNSFISNQFLAKYGITDSIEINSITSVRSKQGENYYVYRTQDLVLISTNEILIINIINK